MRTSLNEIKQIEDHLFGNLKKEEEVLFQANLLLNQHLVENVRAQKKTYQLIHAYGREHLRAEIEAVHRKMFTEPENRRFRQKILSLFGAK